MTSSNKQDVAKNARLKEIESLELVQVGQSSSFFRGTLGSYKDIWAHRELMLRLVNREVKARYKDSSLGILWSLFRPIVQLLIYYFVIGQVLGTARSVPDFAVFVFIGITFWTLYTEILSRSTTSIIDNAGLVKKVYLPREVFPLSSVGSALINFGVQCIVLAIGITFLSSYRFTQAFWLAPLAIMTIVIFGSALGLFLAALNVFLRDTQHFVEIYVAVFFWLSPIVYPFTFVKNALGQGWLLELYLANPITIAILGAQKALWSAGSETVNGITQSWPENLELRLFMWLLISSTLFWVGQRIFAKMQGNFAQEI